MTATARAGSRSRGRWRLREIPGATKMPPACPIRTRSQRCRKPIVGIASLTRALAPRCVVAAGPIANLCYSAIAIFAGARHALRQAQHRRPCRYRAAGSAAEEAGFQTSDVVLSINGRRIDNFTRNARVVSLSAGEKLDRRGARGDREITLTRCPDCRRPRILSATVCPAVDPGHHPLLDPSERLYEPSSPIGAVTWGVTETWFGGRDYLHLNRPHVRGRGGDQS